jgi:hypothetical protein
MRNASILYKRIVIAILSLKERHFGYAQRLAALVFIALTGAAKAAPPLLQLPINCQPGRDCWIANHFDHGTGPEVRDHRCGTMTYPRHNGIDFAIKNRQALRDGVAVLAAADARVLAIRDGVSDGTGKLSEQPPSSGQECGNGVVLDHEDGWQTQYCHLREGSVKVLPGQTVAAGAALGLVGHSGKTEFPHLHFTLRRHGQAVDPFAPAGVTSDCSANSPSLWLPSLASELAYSTGHVFHLGVTTRVPTVDEIRDGGIALAPGTVLGPGVPVIVVFAEAFGLLKGDRLQLTLLGADGETIASREIKMQKYQARWTAFVGRHRPDAGWPPGLYTASAVVLREAESSPSAPLLQTFEVR